MSTQGVENKISVYIDQNPQLKEVSREKVVSIMLEKGVLTRQEAQSWYQRMEDSVRKQERTNSTPKPAPAQTTATPTGKLVFSGPIVDLSGMGLRVESSTMAPAVNPGAAQGLQNYMLGKLTEEQAKNEVINTIVEDVSKSYALYQQQDNGVISKGYDKLKNFFNSELSSSNVEEVLALQAVGADNLLLARDGELTTREYYLQNKDHLIKMFIRRMYVKDENTGLDFLDRHRGEMSKKEAAKFLEDYFTERIERLQMDLGTIKEMQHSLVMADKEKTETFLLNVLKQAKNDVKPNLKDSLMVEIEPAEIPLQYDSNKPISFEEVFEYERGQEYRKENVEYLLEKEKEMNFATSAYNKFAGFKATAEELIKSVYVEELCSGNTVKILFWDNRKQLIHKLLGKPGITVVIRVSDKLSLIVEQTVVNAPGVN